VKTVRKAVIALLSAAAIALPVLAQAQAPSPAAAPKPLYRDPVMDGAADVSIIYDRKGKLWQMFYTNRRATFKSPDPKDVEWVHATPIGVATSKDGLNWTYKGEAKIPKACTGATLWAPELYYEAGTYHMYLTVVPGVFHKWGDKAATSFLTHLTSKDLKTWSCGDRLDLGSERIIDASLIKTDGQYRLWFKDERKGSNLFVATSPDLKTWTREATPTVAVGSEGPKAFRFKGSWWMIADQWKGLLVLRSDDAKTWTMQPTRILEEPGTAPTDTAKGQHADVVVTGEGDQERAYIYYFVHQGNEPEAKTDPYWNQRTAVQVAELKLTDGVLSVDRNAPVTHPLIAPKN
jgi:hypothetical protein